MNGNGLNIYTINAIFNKVEFTGIVWVVYILIKSSFYISNSFSSFFSSRIKVCLRCFINSEL